MTDQTNQPDPADPKTWNYIIEVGSLMEVSVDNPKIARLTITIVPLPNDDELGKEIFNTASAAVFELLQAKGLVQSKVLIDSAEAKPDGVTLQ